MKKNILFVTTIVRTVEAFLIPHIQSFLDQGYEVGVAANIDGTSVDFLTRLGVKVHHVPFSRSLFHFGNVKSFFKMRRVCKGYSVLHLHTPIASFLSRMAASSKQKTLYTAHGFHFNEQESWWKNSFFKGMEKVAATKTSELVVTNQDDLKEAQVLFPALSLHYVEGVGVNIEHFSPHRINLKNPRHVRKSLGLLPGTKVIVHIAELNENKRQIDVVEAASLLQKEMTNFVILLIGKGHLQKEIQQEIWNRKLEKHIRCIGFVEDIPSVLNIAHIGLLVSLREGLPRSIMEMMSMEIPVIATNIRGNRDLVQNGKTGYLVDVKSPAQIAQKCRDLLENEEQAKQFGILGRKVIEEQYSLPIILKKMDSIYKKLWNQQD
ncbi:glycosyltransferase family 4 protein [Jeotgalibacillus sp. ET6]|uniref:glycosyltransferase family 4 protein n=1 Tax=Jeotgalibacillus sp. ET6 TaxID=3037260 RepID=UPI002418B8DF|nr:glycosyltransferase family 4 protein [Jeotgalibacillus sp. ET6]MDG5471710.1 glycosyltransferase family 4 protein [Jeotgalibacillus sp. ET6]